MTLHNGVEEGKSTTTPTFKKQFKQSHLSQTAGLQSCGLTYSHENSLTRAKNLYPDIINICQ